MNFVFIYRKHCTNCRCSKADHNVVSDEVNGADGGFYFVGRLLDRPLRTRTEELEFCYGSELEEENGPYIPNGILSRAKDPSVKASSTGKKVKFDWIPQNVSDTLARKYLNQMPESTIPIAGSEGAHFRQQVRHNRNIYKINDSFLSLRNTAFHLQISSKLLQRLEKQFPVHDIEPEKCHDLPPEELKSMQEYVGHVKREVAGLGTVREINKPRMEYFDEDLPPPPPELLQDFAEEDPIYANLVPGDFQSLNINSNGSKGNQSKENLHYARPYNIEPIEEISDRSNPTRVDSFSSSSSSDASGSTGNKQNHAKHGVSKSSVLNSGDGGGNDAERNLLNEAMKHSTLPAGLKCEHCKDVLKTGEVAINAERAGSSKIWHPRCFKCHECQVMICILLLYLESWLLYFYISYFLTNRYKRTY